MNPTQRRAEVLANIVMFAGPMGFGQVDPHLVLAQADLESGGFTSNLAVNANNVFGMTMPRVRPTTATGSTPAHDGNMAVYASLADCVRDYFMRQRYFGIPDTADPVAYMVATVESGYATDPDYLTKWAARAGVPVGSGVVVDTVPAGGDAGTDTGGGALVPLLLLLAWIGTR